MRKIFLLPVLAGLLAASGRAAPPGPIEIPLQFLETPAKGKIRKRLFIPAGIRYLKKLLRPPAGKWKLPELHAGTPVFSVLNLAGKKHILVLDKKSPKSSFYDRLYLDSDGDGDLAEEKAVEALPSPRRGSYRFANFPPIRIELSLPGGKAPYVFRVTAYMRPLASIAGKKPAGSRRLMGMTFYMMPLCAYAGTFRFDGRTYRILLADTNADGRFGVGEEVSTGRGRKKRDLVYISKNANITYFDGMEAQGLLGIGKTLFRLRFRQARGRLFLDPLQGAAARARLPMKVTRLVLVPAGESQGIMWFDPSGEISLPPGSYRLGSYQASRKDDGGNEWILRATAAKGAPAFTAKPGETASLRFGEPFVPKVAVYARFPRLLRALSVTARLSFTLLGAGGERVTDIRSLTYEKSSVPRSPRNRYRPLEPTYKIIELPSLAVAAQGSFHYG